MRDDSLILNSKKNKRIEQDQSFHALWPDFLEQIRSIEFDKTNPGKVGRIKLLDINSWLLLFYGYKYNNNKLSYNIVKDLGEAVLEVKESNFKNNVKLLFTVFHFDLKSFYEVWQYQRNILRLLHQIIRPQFFLGNRFSPKRSWKPKYECICTPSRYEELKIPERHRILDGLVFPVMVTKNGSYKTEKLNLTNFGDGDFITCDGQVIDCIRVNDFWQTRNHLKQRMAFSFLVIDDYDEAPMVICNNFKDMEKAWKLLDAEPETGILIRGMGENLYENYWLVLNKDSAFIAQYKRVGYTLSQYGNNKRGFVTLDGRHVGNLGYTETAMKKMRWLDDFDIERFQKVVYGEESIPQKRYDGDLTPDFDYGVMNLRDLNKENNDYSWIDEMEEIDDEFIYEEILL